VRKLDAPAQGGEAVVQQTHARHILLKITPTMSEDEARKKLVDAKAKIESSRPPSKTWRARCRRTVRPAKGGDLGWLYPGDTVPEFETAMNGLKPGDLSDVVKSPFGLHLIQVIERKSEDVSKEKERSAARQVLTDRKRQEALEDWSAPDARPRLRRVPRGAIRSMQAARPRWPSRSASRPASARKSRSARPGRCAGAPTACWSATPPSSR
jgi:parvulin-like peptidyl-prolyl isomerase